jgi:hypothetical protein
MTTKRAHRWPGFSDAAIHQLLTDANLMPGGLMPGGLMPGGLPPGAPDPEGTLTIPGPLDVRIWCATRMHDAAADASLEPVN